MTTPSRASGVEPRTRTLNRLAREHHERNCPGDEALETRSINHQHVHETEALRQWRREGGRR